MKLRKSLIRTRWDQGVFRVWMSETVHGLIVYKQSTFHLMHSKIPMNMNIIILGIWISEDSECCSSDKWPLTVHVYDVSLRLTAWRTLCFPGLSVGIDTRYGLRTILWRPWFNLASTLATYVYNFLYSQLTPFNWIYIHTYIHTYSTYLWCTCDVKACMRDVQDCHQRLSSALIWSFFDLSLSSNPNPNPNPTP